MGIEKAALKVTIAESFVGDIEKRRETCRNNIYRFQGAHKAFQDSEELLKQATQRIRDQFVGGELEVDLSDPINVGKFIVRTMMQVSKKFHDLTNASYQSAIRSEGEVRGLELAAEGIEKSVSSDRARMMAVAKGIESGKLKVDESKLYEDESDGTRPVPRAVGTHPGLPMKAKRQSTKKKSEDEKKKRVRKAAPAKKKKPTKKKTNAKNT